MQHILSKITEYYFCFGLLPLNILSSAHKHLQSYIDSKQNKYV